MAINNLQENYSGTKKPVFYFTIIKINIEKF